MEVFLKVLETAVFVLIAVSFGVVIPFLSYLSIDSKPSSIFDRVVFSIFVLAPIVLLSLVSLYYCYNGIVDTWN